MPLELGGTDILWFGPGNAPDRIWNFTNGRTHTSHPITLDGDRTPAMASLQVGWNEDIVDLYR